MAKRSAEATIKGYFYQFDGSILEILKLSNDSDSVTIEGIEDIDIKTINEDIAIQCKYYEGTEYNHSIIAKPIRFMLKHFSDYLNGKTLKIKYILRGHYKSGQHKLSLPIDIDFLKTHFLTYSETIDGKKNIIKYHNTLGLSDVNLTEFLASLVIDINADNFNSQLEELVLLLKEVFSCETFSAEHFYYNNALAVIKDLSIKSSPKERTITKKEFLQAIDLKKALFNEWFITYKTKKEYLKQISTNIKQNGGLDESKIKMISLGIDIIQNNNREMTLEIFIENLVGKYYKLNHSLRTAQPLIFILDCCDDTITKLKCYLIDKSIIFNDGFETLNFSPCIFNLPPILNTNKSGNKIAKSSYMVKIISKKTFEANMSKISKPTILFNFSKKNNTCLIESNQFFDVKYCENLSDVYQLLSI